MAKRVVLDAKLDSATAETLREKLLEAEGDDIALDGSGVEQLGGLCLELLLSVRHLWGLAGKAVTIESPSQQLINDLGRFGLSEEAFQGGTA